MMLAARTVAGAARRDLRLVPDAAGCLTAQTAIAVPFSTPRLQGTFGPSWEVEGLALWGAGPLGRIKFLPQAAVLEARALPNRLALLGPDGRFEAEALPDLPCLVLDVEHTTASLHLQLSPASPADRAPDGATTWAIDTDCVVVHLPWAVMAVASSGGVAKRGGLTLARNCRVFIAAGENEREARKALKEVRARSDPLAAARRYRTWCSTRLETSDPELGSLMTHALHAAVSSRKQDSTGRFSGLSAGVGYSSPARTYYRDGYWTCQVLLAFKPDWVREQILMLAGGVHADGEAPSGVITSGRGSWRRWLATHPKLESMRHSESEWWSDHFDSPLFLPILASEYVGLTADEQLLREQAGGRSVNRTLESIGRRYVSMAEKSGGLPQKPRHDRDWADNVYREGLVTYDSMLYLGALRSLSELADHGVGSHQRWRDGYVAGQISLDRDLWLEQRGHYADYRAADGFVEPHLTIDSLVGSWLGVLPSSREDSLLDAAGRLLVTAKNREQPYGDWGVMACYPAYARRADLRSKSSFPFRYHNGGDWPYWDAVYAASLLKKPDRGDFRYPLLRWWTYGLDKGWPEPVEYYSPPFAPGSLLQAWSGLAAGVIVSSFGWSRSGRHAFVPGPLDVSAVRGVWADGGLVDLELKKGRYAKEVHVRPAAEAPAGQ